MAAQLPEFAGFVGPRDQPEAIHPGPFSSLTIARRLRHFGGFREANSPRPPPPIASLRIFSNAETSIRIIAARPAALGAIFDPNSACVQLQHGCGRARPIGGPGGPREREEGAHAQGAAAKPAKLPTRAGKPCQISRLAAAFQHRPSNMPAAASCEPQFSAIVRIRRQLRLVDQVAAELERVSNPKLLPCIPTRTLQIAISGLYFIRSGANAVRGERGALRLFPRYHCVEPWERARKRAKPLPYIDNYPLFPCYQRERENCTCARA